MITNALIDLIDKVGVELSGVRDRKIRLFLNPSESMQMISVIQLALRHPQMEEFPDRVNSLKLIITMLGAAFHDCPNCRRMIEVGWEGND